MKHEKLSNALNEISNKYLEEAAHTRKQKPSHWLGAVAAILALAVLIGAVCHPLLFPGDEITLSGPDTTQPTVPPFDYNPFHGTMTPAEIAPSASAYLLAAPSYPKMAPYSTQNYNGWWNSQKAIHATTEGYADSLTGYWKALTPAVLTRGEENAVFSPLNVYLALAMLAETSQGNSRQQILSLLDADSIEALRVQADQVWRAHYNNDGLSTSILGSSLWLDDSISYDESTVQTLTKRYYASVFQGQMGSAELNSALQDWLNANTGGLLQKQAANAQLSPEDILALATTIYYQVQWQNDFNEAANTQGVFYSPSGEQPVTFMNKKLTYGPYYWGEDFGAVRLNLENGDDLWLILPDEDKSPADILASGHAMDMVLTSGSYENETVITVNLSVPKFDISADLDLKDALQTLGVTDIFDVYRADLSAILPGAAERAIRPHVSSIDHAVRVAINEKGVTAAAFTWIPAAGAAPPPETEINFVLDRPFLFVVESRDGLPVFAGIVNTP